MKPLKSIAHVKRRPPGLKLAVETLARAKGKLERLASAIGDCERRIAELKAHQEKLEAEVIDVEAARDRASEDIRAFHISLDPGNTQPVHATLGRFGEFKSIRAAVRHRLRSSDPAWVSTDEILEFVKKEGNLVFLDSKQESQWRHNIFTSVLRKMKQAGVLERRCPDPKSFVVFWRIAQPRQPVNLTDLRAYALRKGAATVEEDSGSSRNTAG
jgi:hypothetical protein